MSVFAHCLSLCRDGAHHRSAVARLVLIAAICVAPRVLTGCASVELAEFESGSFDGIPSPVFYMDRHDVDENGILAVFVSRSSECVAQRSIEVTVIFVDEDRVGVAGSLFALISEPVRWVLYGRFQDVESFQFVMSQDDSDSYVDFEPICGGSGTYAADDPFDVLFPSHSSAEVPLPSFGEPNSPKIYITTWNHMFREPPDVIEPDRWLEIRDCASQQPAPDSLCFNVYKGSRRSIDSHYRDKRWQ